MKYRPRLVLRLCLLLVPSWFFVRYFKDILDQHSAGSYLIDSFLLHVRSSFLKDSAELHNVEVGDKIIVMAKLEEENTDWVQEMLPYWQRAIYIVNPSQKTRNDPNALITPINKGHESMAYLSYIIDSYHNLPSIIVFLHAHRSGFKRAWHVDAPMHDNVIAMRTLQLDYVQQSGYVNLRCNWRPGCKKAHRINAHVTDEVWVEVFTGTSTPPRNDTSASSSPSLQTMDKPKEVGAACCAQFAVTRERVHRRPLADYIQFRNWIIDTDKDDASSGRVMEFLWHIIFGMDAVL